MNWVAQKVSIYSEIGDDDELRKWWYIECDDILSVTLTYKGVIIFLVEGGQHNSLVNKIMLAKWGRWNTLSQLERTQMGMVITNNSRLKPLD